MLSWNIVITKRIQKWQSLEIHVIFTLSSLSLSLSSLSLSLSLSLSTLMIKVHISLKCRDVSKLIVGSDIKMQEAFNW